MVSSTRRLHGQDLNQAFKAGNHSHIAFHGDTDDWRYFASLGLIGLDDKAVSGLSGFDGEEPRYYEAVAHWIAGREAEARQVLSHTVSSDAQALKALIDKDTIHVLSMLPSPSHASHVQRSFIIEDTKFQIRNIGAGPGDVPLVPNGTLADYLDDSFPPDFFIAQMIEWHLLPLDIARLDCPLFGHTADYDMHLQATLPWMRMMDMMLVADHDEHAQVAALTGKPVSVSPLVFGCPPCLPVLERRRKDVDLFLSGTLFAPWHPDKSTLIHALFSSGIDISVVNGFLPQVDYYARVASSRLALGYYRRPGGMVTRGIESAALGCVTMLQPHSVVGLYAPEDNGLVTYDPLDPDGLRATIQDVLANYPEWDRKARSSSSAIRKTLAPARVASRYMRRLAVEATRCPRSARGRPPERPMAIDPSHKRVIFRKGWLPANGNQRFLDNLWVANAQIFNSELKGMKRAGVPAEHADYCARLGNDALRETLLRHLDTIAAPNWSAIRLRAGARSTGLRGLLPNQASFDELTQRWLDHFSDHPDYLVLAFNAIRVGLHFGSDSIVALCMTTLKQVLQRPPQEWRVHPMDDVLPYDLLESDFDYRTFLDLSVAIESRQQDGAVLDADGCSPLVEPVLGALYHYAGLMEPDPAICKQYQQEAVRLSPKLESAVLRLVETLIDTAEGNDLEQAEALLVRQANQGMAPYRVSALLDSLEAKRGKETVVAIRAKQHAQRIMTSYELMENTAARQSGLADQTFLLGQGGMTGAFTLEGASERTDCPKQQVEQRGSIVFVDVSAEAMRRWLAHLDPEFETLCVCLTDSARIKLDHTLAVDKVIYCCHPDMVPDRRDGMDRGGYAASGPWLFYVVGDILPDANTDALITDVLINDPPSQKIDCFGRKSAFFLSVHRAQVPFKLDVMAAGPLKEQDCKIIDEDVISGSNTPSAGGKSMVTQSVPTQRTNGSLRNYIKRKVIKKLLARRPGSARLKAFAARYAGENPWFKPTVYVAPDVDLCGPIPNPQNVSLLHGVSTRFMRHSGAGLKRSIDAPTGQCLFGPYLKLPEGVYQLDIVFAEFEADRSKAAIRIELIVNQQTQTKRPILLHGPQEQHFTMAFELSMSADKSLAERKRDSFSASETARFDFGVRLTVSKGTQFLIRDIRFTYNGANHTLLEQCNPLFQSRRES